MSVPAPNATSLTRPSTALPVNKQSADINAPIPNSSSSSSTAAAPATSSVANSSSTDKSADKKATIEDKIAKRRAQILKLMEHVNKDRGRENCPHVAYRLDTELRRMHIKKEAAAPDTNPVPTDNPKVLVRFHRSQETQMILNFSTTNTGLIDRCDVETCTKSLIDLTSNGSGEEQEKLFLDIVSSTPEMNKSWGLEHRITVAPPVRLFMDLQALPRRASDGTTQGFLLFENLSPVDSSATGVRITAHIANFFVDCPENGNAVYILDAQPEKVIIEHVPNSQGFALYMRGFRKDLICIPTVDKSELLAQVKPPQLNYADMLPPLNMDDFIYYIQSEKTDKIKTLVEREPKLLTHLINGETGIEMAVRLGKIAAFRALGTLTYKSDLTVVGLQKLIVIAERHSQTAILDILVKWYISTTAKNDNLLPNLISHLDSINLMSDASPKKIEIKKVIQDAINNSPLKEKIMVGLKKLDDERLKKEQDHQKILDDVHAAVMKEDIDKLQTLFQAHGFSIFTKCIVTPTDKISAFNKAISKGKVKVLEWLHYTNNRELSHWNLLCAIEWNQLESAQFVLNNINIFKTKMPHIHQDAKTSLEYVFGCILKEIIKKPISDKENIIKLIAEAIEKSPNKDLDLMINFHTQIIKLQSVATNPVSSLPTAPASYNEANNAASSSGSGDNGNSPVDKNADLSSNKKRATSAKQTVKLTKKQKRETYPKDVKESHVLLSLYDNKMEALNLELDASKEEAESLRKQLTSQRLNMTKKLKAKTNIIQSLEDQIVMLQGQLFDLNQQTATTKPAAATSLPAAASAKPANKSNSSSTNDSHNSSGTASLQGIMYTYKSINSSSPTDDIELAEIASRNAQSLENRPSPPNVKG